MNASNVLRFPTNAVTDSHEASRIAAVRRYDILDTPQDGTFDRITQLAARLFGTPIAVVSIVDTDRIWFKSHYGTDLQQVNRDPGLCASAILQNGPWLVTDAASDPRTLANPLVEKSFGLAFYLGIPLRTQDGYNLGTLCVLDFTPRTVTVAQIAHLEDLARILMDQLELRLSSRRMITALSVAVEENKSVLQQSTLSTNAVDRSMMNNLAVITAMLKSQRAEPNGTSAPEISKAVRKIVALGRLQQQLQLNDPDEVGSCLTYLEHLCDALSSLMDHSQGMPIIVQAIPLRLSNHKIRMLGLIVSELISNALAQGATRLQLSLIDVEEDEYCLSLVDNGNGLPKGFDPHAMAGQGLKIVAALVKALNGTLYWASEPDVGGACFSVAFRT